LDVTVTTGTTPQILVCKPQPCEHRSHTENHPSHDLITGASASTSFTTNGTSCITAGVCSSFSSHFSQCERV
jgi:hypothetical protein